jgi:hypothetical protein
VKKKILTTKPLRENFPNNETKIIRKNSKEYKLISPQGEIIKIKNLTKFAKDNDLVLDAYSTLYLEEIIHKGWKNARDSKYHQGFTKSEIYWKPTKHSVEVVKN